MLPRDLTTPLTRLALPLAGALLLASCAGGQSTAMGTLAMTLTEFKYTPAQIEATAGAPLTLALTNGGTVEHDFVIDAARIHIKPLQPGQKAEQAFGPLAAGTYEIYCSIPGHKEAGMKAKLTVK